MRGTTVLAIVLLSAQLVRASVTALAMLRRRSEPGYVCDEPLPCSESLVCQNRGPERLGARRCAVGAWEAQSSACFVKIAILSRREVDSATIIPAVCSALSL